MEQSRRQLSQCVPIQAAGSAGGAAHSCPEVLCCWERLPCLGSGWVGDPWLLRPCHHSVAGVYCYDWPWKYCRSCLSVVLWIVWENWTKCSSAARVVFFSLLLKFTEAKPMYRALEDWMSTWILYKKKFLFFPPKYFEGGHHERQWKIKKMIISYFESCFSCVTNWPMLSLKMELV